MKNRPSKLLNKKYIFNAFLLVCGIQVSSVGVAEVNSCDFVWIIDPVQSSISQQELEQRIENLIDLQLQIQNKKFENEEQTRMALDYFQREVKGLANIFPSFKDEYKKRYQTKADEWNQNYARLNKVSQNKKKAVKNVVDNTLILDPIEIDVFENKRKLKSAWMAPDNKHTVLQEDSKIAKVYSIQTKSIVFHIVHEDKIRNFSFSSDHQYLSTASDDKKARVYKIATGEIILEVQHEGEVLATGFLPDQKSIVTVSKDGTIQFFEIGKNLPRLIIRPEKGIKNATFSNDGHYLTIGNRQDIVSIYDLMNPKRQIMTKKYLPLHVFDVSASIIGSLKSVDGKIVARATWDGFVTVFDAFTKKILMRIERSHWDTDVSFSPDSRYLVAVTKNKSAEVFDVFDGKELLSIQDDTWISGAVFSSDGKYFAISSFKGTVKIFDTASWVLLHEIETYQIIQSVNFSPDGKHIIIATDAGRASIFKLHRLLGEKISH